MTSDVKHSTVNSRDISIHLFYSKKTQQYFLFSFDVLDLKKENHENINRYWVREIEGKKPDQKPRSRTCKKKKWQAVGHQRPKGKKESKQCVGRNVCRNKKPYNPEQITTNRQTTTATAGGKAFLTCWRVLDVKHISWLFSVFFQHLLLLLLVLGVAVVAAPPMCWLLSKRINIFLRQTAADNNDNNSNNICPGEQQQHACCCSLGRSVVQSIMSIKVTEIWFVVCSCKCILPIYGTHETKKKEKKKNWKRSGGFTFWVGHVFR